MRPWLAYFHFVSLSFSVVASVVELVVGDVNAAGDDREDEGLESESESARWISAPKLSERAWRVSVLDWGREREREAQERR